MYEFTNILVDVDASATAQPAVEWAAVLARRGGARLRLVHVLSSGECALRRGTDRHDELARTRRDQLARIAMEAQTTAGVEVVCGPAADALIRQVEGYGHDLVVRAHQRDLARHQSGEAPVDVELFRRCPAPVLAVGGGALSHAPRIAVAVDVHPTDRGEQGAAAALVNVGLTLATTLRGSLSLIHAWQPPGDRRAAPPHMSGADYSEYLAHTRNEAVREIARLADTCDGHNLTRRLTIRHGAPAEVIPAFVVSEGIDLLVVGAAGRTGLARRLQGNTAEQVLERVACSVLALKVPVAVAVAT
jgi:universal stress protein E